MNTRNVPPDGCADLVAETLQFTLVASNLPGVTRLVLIGSLTTEKKDPNDADLVVTVTGDADLEQSARLQACLQQFIRWEVREFFWREMEVMVRAARIV